MSRTASVSRTTGETDILIELDLDGTGKTDISTGVGFFDHMLTALGRHSLIDLRVRCEGDTWVDDHHTVEDVGIALGDAINEAIGNKRGIRRFADVAVPLDEALVQAVIDFSGRGELYWDVPIGPGKVGSFDTELGEEFFVGFARNAGISIPRAVERATRVPAQELGCLDQRGILEPGRLANITVFDDEVNICATFVRGQICYSN